MLLAIALANLPDLDFLPGLLLGAPSAFHRGPSHSLATALACGTVVGLLAWRCGCRPVRTVLTATAAYGSHLVLDCLSADPGAEAGVPLLWPFTDRLFLAPWTLFLSIEKSSASAMFIPSLFTVHNLAAIAWEVTVLLPAVLLLSVPGSAGIVPRKPRKPF